MADGFFEIKDDNNLGYYNQPTEKINFIAARYIKNRARPLRHNSNTEDIRIKLSIDGLQLTKTHRQILNVTFTLINECERACTSKGNYLLGKLY